MLCDGAAYLGVSREGLVVVDILVVADRGSKVRSMMWFR